MIRLYHTSDLHDHRGFVSRLDALRQSEPGLLADCGDSLRGSQSVYHRREPVIEEMDRARYDVQAIGNREFHYLFAVLRARACTMHHPLVCSNLIDLRGRELPFAQRHVLYADDARVVRVHFLALLVPQYRVGSPWERIFGWRFLSPDEVVAEYARGMPNGDALVILSHIGLRQDRRLAAAVPRIDLVLGGHSHDTLFEPAYVGEVPIVHAGPYGQYVSRTELHYDDARARHTISRFDLLPLLGAP